MSNFITSEATSRLRQLTANHPEYVEGRPLVLDFPMALAAIMQGEETPEAELLRMHLEAATAANSSICFVYDCLRASARGDARTGRTLRSLGSDGLPYWTGLGSSKAFRYALASIPGVTQSHAAHDVHTENGPDGTSGQAGRSWQGSGFTRTRTRVEMVSSANLLDADGMDEPAPAPTATRKRGRKSK